MPARKTTGKTVETFTYDEATRKNIPTAEFQSVLRKDEQDPIRVAYERCNRDFDPQLVWRGAAVVSRAVEAAGATLLLSIRRI